MIEHWCHKFLYKLGYRRVLMLPSEKGLSMADFYSWKYRPDLPKIYYTEHNYPAKVRV